MRDSRSDCRISTRRFTITIPLNGTTRSAEKLGRFRQYSNDVLTVSKRIQQWPKQWENLMVYFANERRGYYCRRIKIAWRFSGFH